MSRARIPATSVAMPPCTAHAADPSPKNPASSPSSIWLTQSGLPLSLPVNAESTLDRNGAAILDTAARYPRSLGATLSQLVSGVADQGVAGQGVAGQGSAARGKPSLPTGSLPTSPSASASRRRDRPAQCRRHGSQNAGERRCSRPCCPLDRATPPQRRCHPRAMSSILSACGRTH